MIDAPAAWADAALAAALLAVDPGLDGAVVRAGPGPVRDAWLTMFQTMLPTGSPWRRLPPNADDGRMLGGLDLGAALGAGRKAIQRGLLAEADGGVVIAIMAERLTAAKAARLASALEDGVVTVEREGLAASLPSRFVLIALDEGAEPDERAPDAVADRLAFHLDFDAIGRRDLSPTGATPAEVAEARLQLARVEPLGDAALAALCAAAVQLGVPSLRAPMLAARAARALAAVEGREAVDEDDLRTAARLVLAPRATRMPEAAEAAGEPPADPQGDPPPPDDLDEGEDLQPSLDDLVLAAARSAIPAGVAALWAEGRNGAARGGFARTRDRKPARRGRRIGVRQGAPRAVADLDMVETLKAAAPWQRLRGNAPDAGPGRTLRFRRDDFRIRRYEPRAEAAVIFAVDASGSSALARLAEAKGAVELLLAEAYVRRTQVALIAFRGKTAELLLPPTRSLTRARRALADLAGGGATPLAAALEAATDLALSERAKGRSPFLVILTDGRANIALDGLAFRTRAETDAVNAARRIRVSGVPAALVDTSPRPRGEGARLAEAMGGRLAPLPYVEAGALRDVARALSEAG